MPNPPLPEAAVEWPDGNKRERVLYFCPRCKVECQYPWHTCESGGLIPQAAVETTCVKIVVIPKDAAPSLRAQGAEEERERLREKVQPALDTARTLAERVSQELDDYAAYSAAEDTIQEAEAALTSEPPDA